MVQSNRDIKRKCKEKKQSPVQILNTDRTEPEESVKWQELSYVGGGKQISVAGKFRGREG